MRTRLLRALAAMAMLAAVMGAGACGSGGNKDKEAIVDLSPREVSSTQTAVLQGYFAAYEAALEVNDSIRALDQRYPDAFKDDVAQTKALYAEYVGLYDEFLVRFLALEPPDAVEDLHRETLAANERLNAINHARLAKLNDATMADEVAVIFAEDPAFTAAVAEKVGRCLDAEALAAAYGIEFDGGCEE